MQGIQSIWSGLPNANGCTTKACVRAYVSQNHAHLFLRIVLDVNLKRLPLPARSTHPAPVMGNKLLQPAPARPSARKRKAARPAIQRERIEPVPHSSELKEKSNLRFAHLAREPLQEGLDTPDRACPPSVCAVLARSDASRAGMVQDKKNRQKKSRKSNWDFGTVQNGLES